MAQSNLERVGRALELLNKGLKPFIEREMLAKSVIDILDFKIELALKKTMV